MNTKELKDKILQLAIRGKLVGQNENDTPASELLKEIKLEKERLIKEKKIKKEKPLSEISEEEKPFELPKGWEWCRFSDICNFKIGKTPKRAETKYWIDGQVPWVSISDLVDGKKVIETKEKITCLADTEVFKGNISKKGTLVMSFKLSIGKVSILDMDAYHNEAIISIYPYLDCNDNFKMYLFKILPSLDLISDTKSAIKGNTLNSESIRNILVPLPPLEEQKCIVEKGEQLFSLIDELEGNKQDLLEGIKKSREKVLQLAIEGKLVEQNENDTPAKFLLEEIKAEKERLIKEKKIKKEKPLPEITDEEKYFELPRGWEWCRLNDISQYIQRGKSPKYSEIKNIPVISQKCIQWSGLNIEAARFIDPDTLEEYSNEKMLEVGDLLWNSTGSGTLGRISIYPRVDQYKKVVVDSHVTVVRVLKKLINFNYLFVWLAGPIVQSEIEKRSNGSTNQIELSTGTIKSYLVPLPPLEEQRRIVAKVDELMKYFDDLEKQIYS